MGGGSGASSPAASFVKLPKVGNEVFEDFSASEKHWPCISHFQQKKGQKRRKTLVVKAVGLSHALLPQPGEGWGGGPKPGWVGHSPLRILKNACVTRKIALTEKPQEKKELKMHPL